MNGSYSIGTAFGIPIRIHWSFVVIVAVLWGRPWGLVLLFGSVLLHELGHGLMAKRFGVRVVDITLWPLGGMARLTAMPEVPHVEALVALAGPAVNVVLAGLGSLGRLWAVALSMPLAAAVCEALVLVNLILGLFNLVPAFPMDGGRVLRAWLGRTRGWVRATEDAVRVGRFVALAMIFLPLASAFLALFSPGPSALAAYSCSLPLIGLFVLFAGFQELVGVRLRHGLAPIGGRAAGPWPGGGFDPLRREPAQPEATWEPADPAEPPPAEGARRPAQWDEVAPRRRGFDEAAIEALERFRGRLRRPPGG